jgi:ribosome-associated translation inhibitor RaiA
MDNDGEIVGVSVRFSNDISFIETLFCSDEVYASEIAIINEIQKQLRLEKARYKEFQKIEVSKMVKEIVILNKIAALEAELEKLRKQVKYKK